MDSKDIQQIADAVEGNESLLAIVIGLMIAVSPKLYKMIQKRLSKQVDEKVKLIAEEITKPIAALTKSIQEMHETQMQAHKMWMDEFQEMKGDIDEIKEVQVKHGERITGLEP